MLRLLTLTVLLMSIFASGEGIVSTRLSQETVIELANSTSKSQSQSFSIVTPKILKLWTLGLAYQNRKEDYATKFLTGKSGQIIPLSAFDDGARSILSSSVEYQNGTVLTSIAIAQDTKSSAFSSKSYNVTLKKEFFSSSTQTIISFENSMQNLPENYFINPFTLQSQKRIETINSQRVTLGLEQILTEFFVCLQL